MNGVSKSNVVSKNRPLEKNKVTGITVNGVCLMTLQKIRKKTNTNTPPKTEKKTEGRKKKENSLAPSIVKTGIFKQRRPIGRKKQEQKQEDSHEKKFLRRAMSRKVTSRILSGRNIKQ